MDITDEQRAVGARIASWRVGVGMTQRNMAAKIGCSQPSLSYYERGHRSIPFEAVQTYARELGVSIDLLTTKSYHEAVAEGIVTTAP